ncbi:MAG: hypothetical protein WD851_22280 [Pirellulales bacterium]
MKFHLRRAKRAISSIRPGVRSLRFEPLESRRLLDAGGLTPPMLELAATSLTEVESLPATAASEAQEDCGCGSTARDDAVSEPAVPTLALVDAAGVPLDLVVDANTLVIGAATWCAYCAEFKQLLAAPLACRRRTV